MTLDELHWVLGVQEGYVVTNPDMGYPFEAWKIMRSGFKFSSSNGLEDCTAGTYTFRDFKGEEWINLEPIEAQAVLNYLVGSGAPESTTLDTP